MKDSHNQFQGYSLLLLRLVMAFIFLFHGIPKAINWSMAAQKFIAMGFPGFLGPIVGIVEVIASVLILVGLFSKWDNLALLVIIAGAIAGVQLPASLEAGTVTPGLERDLLIATAAIALIAFGPGALGLRRSRSNVGPELN